LAEAYYDRAIVVTEDALVRGGVRLGGLLNKIYK
jgi:hypothetical protein